MPRQRVSALPSSCTCIVSIGPTAENSARLEQSLRAFPTAKVETRDEFRNSRLSNLNRLLHILYALLGLSVLVSMFGVRRPAMIVLPAPGSSASRNRSGWRGSSSP
jgi:hypothetical protein